MNRNELLDKIRKLQALAERGIDGERISAEKRLAEIMDKYGITWEEIDNEEKRFIWYSAKGKDWKMLITQLLGINKIHFAIIESTNRSKRAKIIRYHYPPRREENVLIECTYSKFIELTTAYEIFQRSFDEHYESFVYAFLDKNHLLAEGDADYDPTPEDVKRYERSRMMIRGIEKAEINKQIEFINQ